MNKRIRELAEQAGITTNIDTTYFEKDPNKWVDYYSEKFAELIINECLKTLNPDGDLTSSREEYGRIKAMNIIKMHFGVK
jgi:hypothetical protein